jgi:maleylpyruvate isomerase
MKPSLLSFYRSSAAFRVRIALNLKNIDHLKQPIDIIKFKIGDNSVPSDWEKEFSSTKMVPIYQENSRYFTQSLAIIEYLNDTHPDPPLLPAVPADRAWVRSIAYDIGCDIHPLNNLRVLRHLKRKMEASKEDIADWQIYWLQEGLLHLERKLGNDKRTREFCYGDAPTLADICLVPQVFNAIEAGIPNFAKAYPTLHRISKTCLQHPAFRAASWESQEDSGGRSNPNI